ncbi:hypothetical protein DFJ73DRAFT_775723 [Zopfochytrium polystomum]|nr:hypothetical protein DFJ73DRAFT_775723 [Zopfochytrium polystomum]
MAPSPPHSLSLSPSTASSTPSALLASSSGKATDQRLVGRSTDAAGGWAIRLAIVDGAAFVACLLHARAAVPAPVAAVLAATFSAICLVTLARSSRSIHQPVVVVVGSGGGGGGGAGSAQPSSLRAPSWLELLTTSQPGDWLTAVSLVLPLFAFSSYLLYQDCGALVATAHSAVGVAIIFFYVVGLGKDDPK